MKNLKSKFFLVLTSLLITGLLMAACSAEDLSKGGNNLPLINTGDGDQTATDDQLPDSGGFFAITDIPEVLNEKYALIQRTYGWTYGEELEDPESIRLIWGIKVPNASSTAGLNTISNGSVKIPMWVAHTNDPFHALQNEKYDWVRYSGNDKASSSIMIVYEPHETFDSMRDRPYRFSGIHIPKNWSAKAKSYF